MNRDVSKPCYNEPCYKEANDVLATGNSFLLNKAEHEISMLIKLKKPTIFGIFIFISRENFVLS